jgi:hypothetical protein
MRYVVALYEVDRAYGGPEEGGWWYDTGMIAMTLRVCASEATAIALARRVNRLLDQIQRSRRTIESVLYTGGRYRACLFERIAPEFFPAERPTYS